MEKNDCPLVSIGVPVYNVGPYVTKSILSVLNQTYPYMEVIIVDDCSTDNSLEVIENIKRSHPRGGNLKIYKNLQNSGPGVSRNKVIDESSGKYVYFIDSDDFIDENTIEIMVNQAEIHQADIVIASMQAVYYDTNEIEPAFSYPSLKIIKGQDAFADYVCSDLHSHIGISACNTLFDISFLKDNNLRLAARKDEDALFLSDYYSEVKCAVLMPNITYNYLVRPGSIMGNQERAQIPVEEIRERFRTDRIMTENCRRLKSRSFYDVHCSRVVKHKFRAVCIALRHRYKFTEKLSNKEICREIRHPATLGEILKFKRYRLYNLFFFFVGKLPSPMTVGICYILGKLIRWI